MCRVVIAEEHEILREGLQRLLAADGIDVVGDTGDGRRILPVVDETRPDVLLLGISLSGLNGTDVLRALKDANRVRVIVLSAESGAVAVVTALRNGASGYVLKASPAVEIVKAVRVVASGGLYVNPEIAESIMRAIGRGLLDEPSDPYDRLTRREREIFQFMVEGLSNPEIGARLSISPRTVETHRSQIRRRLDLRNQTDVIRFALKRGLLKLDP